jgi:hypothetical protein
MYVDELLNQGRPAKIEVSWARSGPVPRVWYALETLDLDRTSDTAGVYVIWHEGKPSRTVAVGQCSSIKQQLSTYKNHEGVLAYREFGTLRATWATVPDEFRDGVEKYLVDLLTPLMGDAPTGVTPIAVGW